MTSLPSQTIDLRDVTGVVFGTIRLAPKTPDATKGDCIFDMTPKSDEQAERHEVRWLCKRGFRQEGEHKFTVNGEGQITITHSDFRLLLLPDDEHGLRTQPPHPVVYAAWGPSASE